MCRIDRDIQSQLLSTDSRFPSVPVLGIVTKTDELMRRYQLRPAPEKEIANFVQLLERELGKQPHPPADFIQLRSGYILSECQLQHSTLCVQGMHHDSEESRALCNRLLQTTKALSQLPHRGLAPISE
jgi:hypothetical protein